MAGTTWITSGEMDLCNLAYKASLVRLTAASATDCVITPRSHTQKVIIIACIYIACGKVYSFYS